ncbi:hypothetical protein BG74_09390, partial [Sodalis-like endosymbiont of Proechinophthirus fluctus]|uniref:hypothetical protein n=1 Tax=Sodalis-like endosymbiont of Proechinophthirus fluctus TaxID=1462730 RepID=UPI0007A811E0
RLDFVNRIPLLEMAKSLLFYFFFLMKNPEGKNKIIKKLTPVGLVILLAFPIKVGPLLCLDDKRDNRPL